ncbi:MAG: hypothetical protein HY513_03385 [Candidatus Aenigmarchaeota archaeon]|nr:hypothetical protein [Candidatus Aenigmarchaeota archaeon]
MSTAIADDRQTAMIMAAREKYTECVMELTSVVRSTEFAAKFIRLGDTATYLKDHWLIKGTISNDTPPVKYYEVEFRYYDTNNGESMVRFASDIEEFGSSAKISDGMDYILSVKVQKRL